MRQIMRVLIKIMPLPYYHDSDEITLLLLQYIY